MDNPLPASKHDTGELLWSLFESTAKTTGEEFFQALVEHLAQALEVRLVFAAELIHEGKVAKGLATTLDGRVVPNIEYAVAGTPCANVAGGEIVQIKKNLRKLYPDEGVEGLPVESYLGIPLVGRDGGVLGHVVAMDDYPMIEKSRDFSTFKLFAARATAELERRRTQEALNRTQEQLIRSEKLAAIGQLTAGVTHELNTPIGVLHSNADLTIRTVDKLKGLSDTIEGFPSEAEKSLTRYLDALEKGANASLQASKRVAEIVNNLKAFTRLDGAVFEEYDLHEGIESSIALLEPLQKPGVSFIRNFGSVPLVPSYPTELNQAFMALLHNAAEAIEDSGNVTVKTWTDCRNAYIRISDTGRGIPQDQLTRIFDIGFTVKGGRVGMRTGLPIANAIIVGHGGRIEIKSKLAEGTAFTIELPLSQNNPT